MADLTYTFEPNPRGNRSPGVARGVLRLTGEYRADVGIVLTPEDFGFGSIEWVNAGTADGNGVYVVSYYADADYDPSLWLYRTADSSADGNGDVLGGPLVQIEDGTDLTDMWISVEVHGR